jgi:hypothetical protein
MAAHLAAKLGASFAIIVVEVLSWSIAMLAAALARDSEAITGLDRIQGLTVFSLIVFEEFLPIDRGGFGFLCGLLAKWG